VSTTLARRRRWQGPLELWQARTNMRGVRMQGTLCTHQSDVVLKGLEKGSAPQHLEHRQAVHGVCSLLVGGVRSIAGRRRRFQLLHQLSGVQLSALRLQLLQGLLLCLELLAAVLVRLVAAHRPAGVG
jgi:hypothetical protein